MNAARRKQIRKEYLANFTNGGKSYCCHKCHQWFVTNGERKTHKETPCSRQS